MLPKCLLESRDHSSRPRFRLSVIEEIDVAVFTLSDGASHFRFPPSVGIPGTGSLKSGATSAVEVIFRPAVDVAAVLAAVKDKPFGWPPNGGHP